MKKVILVVIGCCLIVSFGFMGGWPFISSEESQSLDRVQEEKPAAKDGASTSESIKETDGAARNTLVAKPDKSASPEVVRTNRGVVSAAKKRGMGAHRQALTEAILNPDLPEDYRTERLQALRRINRDTVFRPGHYSRAVDVKIVAGDSLTRIARRVKKSHKNNVTPAFLMKMNRMPNPRIRAGNLVSAPTESLSVVISKSDYRLYVLLGSSIVLDYPVGIGHSNSTPKGQFLIRGKTKNPTWTRPDGKVIRFGEEGHTIGSRWLGFSDKRGRTPYGIHGTVENESIGKAESEGCIRMLKDDVEEIFRLIPEGCPVEIRP